MNKDTIIQRRDREYLYPDVVSRLKKLQEVRGKAPSREDRLSTARERLAEREADNETLRRLNSELDIELYKVRRELERARKANEQLKGENQQLQERLRELTRNNVTPIQTAST